MRMEGQKWTSLCPDQGCLCAKGGERHTGNKLGGGGYSNDTMASDLSTPQFRAINDGSSVFSNSIMYGVLESSLRVIIYYILLCIRVCAFYK